MTTHACPAQDARATKAWCGQVVGVAGVVQHEPGGTDVSQPSCMTGRCDLSLLTPQSQPGEGVGSLAPVLDGLFLSSPIFSVLEEGDRAVRYIQH